MPRIPREPAEFSELIQESEELSRNFYGSVQVRGEVVGAFFTNEDLLREMQTASKYLYFILKMTSS